MQKQAKNALSVGQGTIEYPKHKQVNGLPRIIAGFFYGLTIIIGWSLLMVLAVTG